MNRPLFALLLGLSACSQPASQSANTANERRVPTASCEANNNPICAFFNAPLTLLTTPIQLLLHKETYYPTANELQFVDSGKKAWTAPKGTLTDGASIPRVFVPMVGSPTSREFVNAAAIHDAYCGAGNDSLVQYHSESWQNVHRMFYDALRVGGTPSQKAKIMYSAVYLGGPRWTVPRQSRMMPEVTRTQNLPGFQISSKSIAAPTSPSTRSKNGVSLRKLGISDQRLRVELQKAVDFINTENPSIAALERYLILRDDALEAFARHNQNHLGGDAESHQPSNLDGPNDPGYPSDPVSGPASPTAP